MTYTFILEQATLDYVKSLEFRLTLTQMQRKQHI